MKDADAVNILVVDDLPEKRMALEAVLEDLGQTIVSAASGREALRRLLDQDFAVILLDVNMPEMNGFETAALVRQHPRAGRTPIIFITAFSDEVQAARGYELGAVDYILSPVVPEILRTKVGVFVELFKKTRLIKRHAEQQILLEREQAARAAAEEAQRRSEFLAEAGTVLASSLDGAALRRGLTRLAVPFLADLCFLCWRDEPASGCQTEAAWAGPGRGTSSQSLEDPGGLPNGLPAALERILAGGQAESLTGPVAGKPAGGTGDLHNFRVGPALVLPLTVGGQTVGVLGLARGPNGSPYEAADRALARDLAGRVAAALDNARLYQNLQEADRRKDEFLAMLAHELRNPLAPICNALQILRPHQPAEPDAVEAYAVVERQVLQLSRIVDELLDVFRLTHQKVVTRKETLDLVHLVRQTVEDYRAALDGARLTATTDLPNEGVWVLGDRTRLAQVLGNLLQNAIKFSNPGGRVFVRVGTDAHRATVSVRDTGIGIAPELLPSIFDTFTQADHSLARSRGGLGLGLPLVKGLVEMHGGQVRALSPGLGKGTEVQFWLPLTARPRTPPRTPAAAVPAGRKVRVLIIEDSQDTARTLQVLLTRFGHEVTMAHSGPAGVAAARQGRPDVVLCDLGLPEMDGYEVARALRGDAATARTRLIAVSGYGQEEDRRRSEQAGFDLHLTKPVDPIELQRLLASLPVGSS
jgi:CheY-like chemotaxis protein